MTISPGDTVVVEYTGRTPDGVVFDTSEKSVAAAEGLTTDQPKRSYSPLTFEVGAGDVLEGLEKAVVGLKPGATPTVQLPPEKAHGEWSENQVTEYDLDDFRQSIDGRDPEEGGYLETQNGDRAEIIHVGDDIVRVDFNSPLAGETLEFDLEVLRVD